VADGAPHRGEEQGDPFTEHRDGAPTAIERAAMRRAVDPLRESRYDHDLRRSAPARDLARHALAVSGHPSRAHDRHRPRDESRLVAVDPQRVGWMREVPES
jgi:hypothetical protein